MLVAVRQDMKRSTAVLLSVIVGTHQQVPNTFLYLLTSNNPTIKHTDGALAWFTGLVLVSYSATTKAKSCLTFQLNAGARSASTSMLRSNRSVPSDFRNVRNLLTPSFLTSGNPGHRKHKIAWKVVVEVQGARTSCTSERAYTPHKYAVSTSPP